MAPENNSCRRSGRASGRLRSTRGTARPWRRSGAPRGDFAECANPISSICSKAWTVNTRSKLASEKGRAAALPSTTTIRRTAATSATGSGENATTSGGNADAAPRWVTRTPADVISTPKTRAAGKRADNSRRLSPVPDPTSRTARGASFSMVRISSNRCTRFAAMAPAKNARSRQDQRPRDALWRQPLGQIESRAISRLRIRAALRAGRACDRTSPAHRRRRRRFLAFASMRRLSFSHRGSSRETSSRIHGEKALYLVVADLDHQGPGARRPWWPPALFDSFGGLSIGPAAAYLSVMRGRFGRASKPGRCCAAPDSNRDRRALGVLCYSARGRCPEFVP